jgi:uracil phosphoribosyltransferase
MLGEFKSPLLFLVAGTDSLFLLERIATSGSAMKAVEVLKAAGVLEERIIFVNLVSTPTYQW